MEDEALRKELLIGLEYSYLHDDWVNPLEEALAGVSAEEALTRTGPESKGIWDIVLHMAVWNENIVERIRAGEPSRPSEGSWPSPPRPSDEPAWEQAKSRLWDSLSSVRSMIESTPISAIQNGPYALGDLLCRFVHMGYHIGQITKLRECMDGAN